MAGAGIIMRAIAPGLEERPEVFGEAVTLFRICAPYIWSVMMAAGCMAALHSRQRFLLPSLTPSLFNLCVIGFALLAAFNPSLQPGVLVACGVLCGGILQWLAQVPATRILQREEGKRGKPADARTVSEAFRRLPAGIVGAAMPQLAFLGASALASLLPEGHMASLFYAERLLEFPLGVLGAAVGMAAAPRLAELAASEGLSRSSRFHEIPSFSLSQPQKPEQADPPPPLSASRTARNDTKAIPSARLQKPWDGEGMEFEDGEPFFKRGEPPHGSLSPSPSSLPTAPPHSFSDEIQRAVLLSLGLNLPAAAGLAAISLPLVAVVLGHGAFDAEAVSATALALCAYAPGLPAYALSRPLLAACHALESGLPLKAAAVALAVALAGGYALTLRFGAWGPPLGVSLGLWCNAALLWIGLSRGVSLRLPLRSLAVQLAGTALTFGSAYGVVLWAGHASNIAQLALAIPAGAAVYAASLLIGDRNWFRLLKKR
ncbi:MAG: murein biosynthesis integral membrane protein MurJ [Bilophila wadsworthia]